MIGLILIIPIIGSLLLLPIQINEEDSAQQKTLKQIKMKKIAIITSLLNLVISLYIFVLFDSSTSEYQFVYEFNNLSFCHLNVGLDGVSLYFVLLTTFITPIALLSNYTNITQNLKFFLISFLVLEKSLKLNTKK